MDTAHGHQLQGVGQPPLKNKAEPKRREGSIAVCTRRRGCGHPLIASLDYSPNAYLEDGQASLQLDLLISQLPTTVDDQVTRGADRTGNADHARA